MTEIAIFKHFKALFEGNLFKYQVYVKQQHFQQQTQVSAQNNLDQQINFLPTDACSLSKWHERTKWASNTQTLVANLKWPFQTQCTLFVCHSKNIQLIKSIVAEFWHLLRAILKTITPNFATCSDAVFWLQTN